MAKNREKQYYNEKTWALDCRLALMQKPIWLLCAVLALLGGWLIMHFMPEDTAHFGIIALALLLMIGYQWAAKAPGRALSGWIVKHNQREATPREILSFLDALEKKLPAMKKKEMAFTLTEMRAILMFQIGAQQEAIALLENFDRCWDESQLQRKAEHIRKMKEKMAQTADEKDENS